jgi:hypothetical protein
MLIQLRNYYVLQLDLMLLLVDSFDVVLRALGNETYEGFQLGGLEVEGAHGNGVRFI